MTNPCIELVQLLADLEEDAVLGPVRRRVAAGDEPLKLIEECNAGMRQVGERYEQRQYFLAGLIMAGEIFREVVEIVQPVIVNRTPRQSVDDQICRYVGADHWVTHAMSGVHLCQHLVKGR